MMAGLSSQRPSCLSAQTASPTALFTRSPRVSWALPSRKTSANSENCGFSVSRRTLSRRKIGNDRILCAAAVTSPVRTFSIPQVVILAPISGIRLNCVILRCIAVDYDSNIPVKSREQIWFKWCSSALLVKETGN